MRYAQAPLSDYQSLHSVLKTHPHNQTSFINSLIKYQFWCANILTALLGMKVSTLLYFGRSRDNGMINNWPCLNELIV